MERPDTEPLNRASVVVLTYALDSLEHLIQWAAERGYYSGEEGHADVLDVDDARVEVRKIAALVEYHAAS